MAPNGFDEVDLTNPKEVADRIKVLQRRLWGDMEHKELDEKNYEDRRDTEVELRKLREILDRLLNPTPDVAKPPEQKPPLDVM